MRFLYGSLVAAALVLVQPLGAVPITYIETGQLSGTLGAAPLTNVAFTFYFIGNTANITGAGTGVSPFFNVATSNSIVIGPSNGSFTTAVQVGVNNVAGIIGFSDLGANGGITFTNAGAVGYNLATPIAVSASSPQAAIGSFATSLGALTITGAQNLTFTATLVPEPGTFGLFAVALLGVALAGKRRA